MDDQQLREVLRSIPRQPAPEGFTRQTVGRLGDGRPVRRSWRRLALVAAACAALIGLGVPVGLELHRQAKQERVRDELERLRDDHQQLKKQLAALRASQSQQPELLYLGGTDSADYVVDLRQLARPREEPQIEPEPDPTSL